MVVYPNTPMIRSSDHRYPVYLSDFRSDNPNVSIGSWIYSENLVEFGYFPVLPVTKPSGDVVTEGQPLFDEDSNQWMQTWNVRDFTSEEIADNLKSAKDVRKVEAQNVLTADLNDGIPYPVGGVEFKVKVKGFDLATLLSIKNVAEEDGSESTDVYPFQFLDGYKEDFSHAEMISLVNDVTRAHYDLMKAFWRYLDDVDSSADIASIPSLPATFL